MTKLRPYQQDIVDAIKAMDPDKPFRLTVPMGAVHYSPDLARAVTKTGQAAIRSMTARLPARLAPLVTVGNACAGCGKVRPHRQGRWLCLACVVVPSRDKDIEALRQEYL